MQLLRRVREGGMWWLLVEYDDEYETQGWKGFADEAAVSEFADSVNVGEPLKIPPVSLSPEESATVVSAICAVGSTAGGVRRGVRVPLMARGRSNAFGI